jgi:hypothetical protein
MGGTGPRGPCAKSCWAAPQPHAPCLASATTDAAAATAAAGAATDVAAASVAASSPAATDTAAIPADPTLRLPAELLLWPPLAWLQLTRQMARSPSRSLLLLLLFLPPAPLLLPCWPLPLGCEDCVSTSSTVR